MGSPKYTLFTFLNKAKEIHGNYYDYSLLSEEWWNKNYKNTKTKLPIICPDHGLFYQAITNHIQAKSGCPKCRAKYKRLTYEEFIKQLLSKKMNKYFYFLFDKIWFNSNYKNKYETYFKVKCKSCGTIYHKKGTNLYNGDRCGKCYKLEKLSHKILIEKLKENIYSEKYDYSLITKEWYDKNYVGHRTKVPIICKNCGSTFYQQAFSHYYSNQGCPNCSHESKGEKLIKTILTELNINFKTQYFVKINELNLRLYFDFYLPDYNLIIEFDGEQHYQVVEKFGSEYTLLFNQYKDKVKNLYCKKNNIKLLRIHYSFRNKKSEIIQLIKGAIHA